MISKAGGTADKLLSMKIFSIFVPECNKHSGIFLCPKLGYIGVIERAYIDCFSDDWKLQKGGM